MRLLKFITLILFSVVSASHAASVSDVVTNFKKDFKAKLKENKVPGGAYAIIHNGEIIAMEGHGVRALGSNKKVTPDTVFRLASVSKTFAAGLTAQLVEDNEFSWDDKIVDYVPEFRFKTKSYSDNLTVNHILSQSSSLVHNAYDNLIEANYDMPRIIDKFSEIDPMCKLGQCYGYQNVLYSLIEPVIEQSTNASYTDNMHRKIFDPLEMEHSSLGYESFLETDNRAEPHLLTRKGWVKTKVKPSYYNILPAAGVNASIADMTKWVKAQMGYYPESYSQGVIDTVTTKRVRTRKEMRKRNWRSALKNAHYGYGWRLYDLKGGAEETDLVYHGGSVAGFRSEIAYSKEKDLALVILLNAETRMGSDLNAEFWQEVYKPEAKAKAKPKAQPRQIAKAAPVKSKNSPGWSRTSVPRDKPKNIPATR
ncbi:serine hydrolase domain-containing protein [Pseudemcibacter aquimaris]|uniref:serine hydrolase domain-containing protein n=1 Tax=Pseudemcibacter aquimaris TaxID=2857064 RepID=UPI002011E84F|nr:serine hydrolase domain-containing protein [Pseudemcibacter aquimaris]MCC3860297.1 beta-lactamase family protein [Pseudemcibacter aquimaris]WDU57621.1 beta-lactamase family protein [Pseudemcibacter aquimaris]